MLIEEYENALPLEHFLKNGGGPFDDQVATVGLDAFLVCISFSQISYPLLLIRYVATEHAPSRQLRPLGSSLRKHND